MKKIKIIEQKSEIGAGTRGSSLGIDALKIASLNEGSSFFSLYDRIEVPNRNDLLYTKNETPSANYIDGMLEVYESHSSQVKASLLENEYPVVLSADHTSAGATIAGIKAAYPSKRLGVIWIDAHADLHSPYTTPTGNMHGMPLATALGMDNIQEQVNEVAAQVKSGWEQLKNTSGISPKIKPSDLVFFGVRDTEQPEDALMEREEIKNYSVAETRSIGVQQAMNEALNRLEDCDLIYISFDVDSMDCDLVSYGTGTPVPNGFTPKEAESLILTGLSSEKCVCFELVEVNPTLDNKQNKMADTAFQILKASVAKIEEA